MGGKQGGEETPLAAEDAHRGRACLQFRRLLVGADLVDGRQCPHQGVGVTRVVGRLLVSDVFAVPRDRQDEHHHEELREDGQEVTDEEPDERDIVGDQLDDEKDSQAQDGSSKRSKDIW